MIAKNYVSNDGKKWQLSFVPDGDYSAPQPFKIAPRSDPRKFVARFTQPCVVRDVSIFNRAGLAITPDFEIGVEYRLNNRMSLTLEVVNVSDVERIFDAVAFVEIIREA